MANLDPIIGKETPPLFWFEGFDGVNLHDNRRSIGDEECAWLENLVPLGKGNARSLYDAETPIYTASQNIVYDFPFNIGSTFYKALFLADGSAVQVAVVGGAVTVIAAAATFAVSPTLPACAQWGASGIVIVTANTNGYFAWDGTLYSPGGVAPAWLSGLAAPIIVTGAKTHTSTLVDTISSTSGFVVGMMISSSAGDIPAGTLINSFIANTSAVISNAATGSNTVTITVGWMMPLGLEGKHRQEKQKTKR